MREKLTPSQISDELRLKVLNLNPKDIGIRKDEFPYPVYAVVMETGFADGSFTLASVAEGSTSLYFSNGGGIIGSGLHQSVRDASEYFLSGAQFLYQEAKIVTDFPRPAAGVVSFYFVTFDGVRLYSALEDELGNGDGDFSELFFAAHDVITELRKIDEEGERK